MHRTGHRTDPETRPAPRVLLYSHDSVGLGHLRRTLNVAEAISDAFPGAAMLLASGSVCATHFPTPKGLDVVKLPSIGKDERGAYASRQLPQPLAATVALRRELLMGLVRTFAPDLVIVDQKVLGVADELTPVLELARSMGTKTLLGVRDIIDTPEVVASEWGRPAIRAALANLYDRVLVYGAPEVFDARIEYPFPPELRDAVRFTGYVVRPARGPFFRAVPALRRRVVVTTGGGEDGGERVTQYLGALELAPYDWDTELVLGPMLDPDASLRLTQRARALPGCIPKPAHACRPSLAPCPNWQTCRRAARSPVAAHSRKPPAGPSARPSANCNPHTWCAACATKPLRAT